MRKLLSFGVLALAGCCFFGEGEKNVVTTVSPDGRNEIRLWTNPLAYEVTREGKTLVAKTEIGMKVDGKCLPTELDGGVVKWTNRSPAIIVDAPVYKKAKVDVTCNDTIVHFKGWDLHLVARNDGVAYRFETKLPGKVTVNCEKAGVALDDSTIAYVNFSDSGYNGDQFQ